MRLASANQVCPAVADLRQVQMIVEHARGGRRRAHAAHLGMRPGVRVNARVGDLDRFLEPVREPLRCRVVVMPGLGEMRVDRVGRHLARELARRRAAHAIGDHEQRAARADLMRAHIRLERGGG